MVNSKTLTLSVALLATNLALGAPPVSTAPKSPPATLNGRVIDDQVVDPRGQAVGQALIFPTYAIREPSNSHRLQSTIAAADGSFQLPRSPLPLLLEAISPDGALAGMARAGEKASDVIIRVGPVATATGRLLDPAGKPVTQGYIRYGIRVPESDQSHGFSQFAGGAALLDAEGRFKLTALIPGESYMLNYRPRGGWKHISMTTLASYTAPDATAQNIPNFTLKENNANGQEVPTVVKQLSLEQQRQLAIYVTSVASEDQVGLIAQRTPGADPDDTLPIILADLLRRDPGLKQHDQSLDAVLLDLVAFKDQQLTDVLLAGWYPNAPIFARLKLHPDGRKIHWSDKQEAMLGAALAKKLNKKLGDDIELFDARKFEVVAIYDSPIEAEAGGIIVNLSNLQRFSDHPDEVSAIFLPAAHPIDARGLEILRRRIESNHPGVEVTVVTPASGDSKLP